MLGGAVLWHRVRGRIADLTGDGNDVITERHAGAFVVRRRLDPDRIEAVLERVDRRCADGDPDWLLGVDGASTASLFLDRSSDEPELRWYVEVPRNELERRDDPATTIAERFPVSHDAVVPGDDSVDGELLVHAVHPRRPRTLEAAEAGLLGRDELASDRTVDVELVRMDLESGLPERLADWLAGVSRRVIDGELSLGPIETWSEEMLEAEAMYTESVVLERRAGGYSLVQYMETAEMAAVYEAYYDTWNPVARAAELVLGRVLENPDDVLTYPIESGTEPLAHAIDPDRFRHPSEC
ncbi:hypothetical protein EA462_03425 [Natrarchaeobius halalkaliphilus]|uniref:Uncharacterized protein n=1 Tax=Natrarchaeobius halalkaliphilus TaxID=1679091 RepID=A0A3N6MCU4_9EURY|nr:hypothetical protein EA462_03425 [Natrarchaeobius halalkaliphilus]